jgi:hypothetical protein
MAAAQGNTYAAKDRKWASMLAVALETYKGPGVEQGKALRMIAEVVVKKALEGDRDAIQEIGNRLDGKPAQAIEHQGKDGAAAIIIQASAADLTI